MFVDPRLIASRGFRAFGLILLAVTIGSAFAPLADHLGFEFALVLAIASTLSAPAVGIAAMRLEFEKPFGMRRPIHAALRAMVHAVGGVAVVSLIMLLNVVRRPVCDLGSGALWVLALAIPSAMLSASLGAFARARTGSQGGAVFLIIAVELASLVVNLGALYTTPAFFFFDHFFGYYPGPLYDETAVLGPSVIWFRIATVAWALTAAIACGLVENDPRHARRSGFIALALAFGLSTISLGFGADLGWRSSDDAIARVLGGRRSTTLVEVNYPREWNEKQVRQLVEDADFRAHQVVDALGLSNPAPVRIWMYRSPEEKRRLVGASATSFAKPWRREVHVHASGFPHPVLRHELVHAFAADLADGPFHVPGGLFPNPPLVEGFAVAFDLEPDGMTLERWARAMRDRQLAPDPTALFSTSGFISSAPARAYTYAGAFIRHLAKTRGREAVLKLYRTGDVSTLGDAVKLKTDFESELDRIELRPAETATAERRFARTSIFRRRCAREVSAVSEAASAALSRNDHAGALELYDQACQLEPDDPALLRDLLTAAIRSGDDAAVDAARTRLLDHPKLDALLKASTWVELGDRAWKMNQIEDARASYQIAVAMEIDAATHRGAVARLRALSDPARASVLKPLLAESQNDVDRLFAMSDYLASHPDDTLVAYLLGRQLVQRDAHARGVAILLPTIGQLGDRELDREALRITVRALSETGRCDEIAPWQNGATDDVDRLFIGDWAERCRFLAKH